MNKSHEKESWRRQNMEKNSTKLLNEEQYALEMRTVPSCKNGYALELRTVPSLQNRNELCTGNGEMS